MITFITLGMLLCLLQPYSWILYFQQYKKEKLSQWKMFPIPWDHIKLRTLSSNGLRETENHRIKNTACVLLKAVWCTTDGLFTHLIPLYEIVVFLQNGQLQ